VPTKNRSQNNIFPEIFKIFSQQIRRNGTTLGILAALRLNELI
jgi:hypothetical protein